VRPRPPRKARGERPRYPNPGSTLRYSGSASCDTRALRVAHILGLIDDRPHRARVREWATACALRVYGSRNWASGLTMFLGETRFSQAFQWAASSRAGGPARLPAPRPARSAGRIVARPASQDDAAVVRRRFIRFRM
jgi:hypothetical protein